MVYDSKVVDALLERMEAILMRIHQINASIPDPSRVLH